MFTLIYFYTLIYNNQSFIIACSVIVFFLGALVLNILYIKTYLPYCAIIKTVIVINYSHMFINVDICKHKKQLHRIIEWIQLMPLG